MKGVRLEHSVEDCDRTWVVIHEFLTVEASVADCFFAQYEGSSRRHFAQQVIAAWTGHLTIPVGQERVRRVCKQVFKLDAALGDQQWSLHNKITCH